MGELINWVGTPRLPPSNLQAEQALLGAIFANNKALDYIDFLRPEHFADPIHGRIFHEVLELHRIGAVVDAVTLKHRFENAGILNEVGGTQYLAQLITAMVGIINVKTYGQAVRDTWLRRELIAIGESLVNGAYSYDLDPDARALALRTVGLLDKAAFDDRGLNDSSVSLDDALDIALADAEQAQRTGRAPGISTGFPTIDRRIGGLERGLMYLLSARPSMGKSALVAKIAKNVAHQGIGVLMLSLEMDRRQHGRRFLASSAGVPLEAIRFGRFTQRQHDEMLRVREEMRGLPMTIDDAMGQTPRVILAKARAAKRRYGNLGLVVVDHLNLTRADSDSGKLNQNEKISIASATMKEIGRELDCAVIALTQLNRDVERREDKRPVLADLRDSGALEQDADGVCFVYRHSHYLGDYPEESQNFEPADRLLARQQQWHAAQGTAELIWAKLRDGETGTDILSFDGPTTTFRERDQSDRPAAPAAPVAAGPRPAGVPQRRY